MTPKAPAVPEDGAKFYGSVRAMPNGEWRSSCARASALALASRMRSRKAAFSKPRTMPAPGFVCRHGTRLHVDGVG